MAKLTIAKTYKDGETPTQVDLDNICDSIEAFLNVTQLGSDNIKTNSIDAGAIISEGSITTGKFATDSVTTAKILDGAVTSNKIAHGAVTTAKILDGAVTTVKIADGAITNAKIANSAITLEKKPTASSAALSALNIQSTGALTTSFNLGGAYMRPTVFCGAGSGALTLNSTSSGAILSASYPIQKDSVTTQNNELKAGPLIYTSGTNTFFQIPASSIFSLDLTMGTAEVQRRYRFGVKSNTTQSSRASGGYYSREIV